MDTSDNSSSPTQKAQGKIPIKLVGAIIVVILIVGALFVLTGAGQKSSSKPLTQNTTIATSTINSTKTNTTVKTTNKTSTNVSAAPSPTPSKFGNSSIVTTAQFNSVLGNKWTYFNTTNGSIGNGNDSVIYYAHFFKYNKTVMGTIGAYSSLNTTKLSYFKNILDYTFTNKSTTINGTIGNVSYVYGGYYRTNYGSGGKIINISRIGTGIVASKGQYVAIMVVYNYTVNLTDAKALIQYQLNDLNTSG